MCASASRLSSADWRRGSELFVESIMREDRSLVELIAADYTFVDERLAAHYGIPGIYGSRFRKVTLDGRRGGLLGHGGLLTVTSYPNCTSPVLRGKWVLENLLGAPPPPPPPDVPSFPERSEDGEPATVRELLEMHRRNPACAGCHAPIDPLGFALEQFDAIGRWRTTDAQAPIDASGVMPTGDAFDGLAGLKEDARQQPGAAGENRDRKLLAYALGRAIEHHDYPVIRGIVRDAAEDDYRWSSIILGIVRSPAFRMRSSSS